MPAFTVPQVLVQKLFAVGRRTLLAELVYAQAALQDLLATMESKLRALPVLTNPVPVKALVLPVLLDPTAFKDRLLQSHVPTV